jgi:hypothetical protein
MDTYFRPLLFGNTVGRAVLEIAAMQSNYAKVLRINQWAILCMVGANGLH